MQQTSKTQKNASFNAYRCFALAALFLVSQASLLGRSLQDHARLIESSLNTDPRTAIESARDLLHSVWERTGSIGFSKAVLSDGDAPGFGIYTPRNNNEYTAGEPIHIYAEPFGFGYGDAGSGRYQIAFDVDLQILDPHGNVLAKLEDLIELNLTSRRKNKEFVASIHYNLTGAGPGEYHLKTTLKDRNSMKSGSFVNIIRIVE